LNVAAISWARQQRGLSATVSFVLVALAGFTDSRGCHAYPGQRTLAAMTGFGERTVRAAIADLEHRGLISRLRRRKDGRRGCDEFALACPPGRLGYQPADGAGSQPARGAGSQPANDDRSTGSSQQKSKKHHYIDPSRSKRSQTYTFASRAWPEDLVLSDAMRAYAVERGYGSQWRRLREWVLAREPLCRACLAQGRTEPATDVDHIVARSRGGSDEPSNLQALCASCHARKTASEDGGFGRDRGGARPGRSIICAPAPVDQLPTKRDAPRNS
jgi:HNH endonuclease/Helix-turn-helix domain